MLVGLQWLDILYIIFYLCTLYYTSNLMFHTAPNKFVGTPVKCDWKTYVIYFQCIWKFTYPHAILWWLAVCQKVMPIHLISVPMVMSAHHVWKAKLMHSWHSMIYILFMYQQRQKQLRQRLQRQLLKVKHVFLRFYSELHTHPLFPQSNNFISCVNSGKIEGGDCYRWTIN